MGSASLEKADAGDTAVVGQRSEYQAGYREAFMCAYGEEYGPRGLTAGGVPCVDHNGRMSDQTQVVRDLDAAFERRDVGAVLWVRQRDRGVESEALPGVAPIVARRAPRASSRAVTAVDATITAEDFF